MEQLPDNSQNFIGVWLDPDTRTNRESYIGVKRALMDTFNHFLIFTDPWLCTSYIFDNPISKILFISSLKYGSKIIDLMKVQNLPQIDSIYLFYSNELEKENWNPESFGEFPIQGVFKYKNELIQRLKDDINTMNTNNQKSSRTTELALINNTVNEYIRNAVPTFSVFRSKSINNSIKNIDPSLIWYIRHRLLLKILLKLEKSATATQDMIYKCRELCENYQDRIRQIDEFEKDAATVFDPIYWYTKDSFIVHLLKRISGSQNVNDIYSFRFFIRNLHDEIIELGKCRLKNSSTYKKVFRGKFLTQSTLKKLEDNKNGLVVMNGFLSTTEDEAVAKCFVSGISNPDQRAVLFEFHIKPDAFNVPYAEIPSKRHAKAYNKEVLFSIGSVWRIMNVQEPKDNRNSDVKLWRVQLKLNNEDDEESKRLIKALEAEIGETSSQLALGDFLTKVGHYEEAEKYYRLLGEILSETAVDWSNIYNRIAYVEYEKRNFSTALDYLIMASGSTSKDREVGIVIKHDQKTIANESSQTSERRTTSRRKFEDNDISIKYLISNFALEVTIKNNYGCILHQQGHFEDALKYYDDALSILLHSESNYLSEMSAVYNNKGGVHFRNGNYIEAAHQFTLAMTTMAKLDLDHPWFKEYYDNYKAAQNQVDSHPSKRSKKMVSPTLANEDLEKSSHIAFFTLTSIRFILLNLSIHLSPLASDMLDALGLLAKDSIHVINDSSTTNFSDLHHATFILFTTSQTISSMKEKPEHLAKMRILEPDKNMVDQKERFATSENLIFQLADDLFHYYKLEMSQDIKTGNISSAKQKEDIANQIHNEMKKVHKKFIANNTANKKSVIATTTLVFLTHKLCGDININDIQNRLINIVPPFLMFDNEENCYDHVQRNETKSAVFVIIHGPYEDLLTARFQKLTNVKNVYRYDQSPSKSEMSLTNYEDLCFELIHDLITHYSKMAAAYDARKDSENAKTMYLKAHELSKLLAEL